MPLAVQRSRHGSAVEGAKHLLHRAEAASTSLAERKSEEQEAARKQHHKSNELGFTAAHGRRITVSDIEKTNRGQRIEGVAAISHAAERSKHATAKETVTKNDVKEFLAGHSWAPTADDEDLGLTWIANSSVASQSASPRKSLSTREIDATRAALEAAPVVRTAAQRLLVRALLGSVDLFSNLTRAEIDALSEVVAVETVADGDIIMTEGEPGEEFCIILSGSVDIFIGGRHVRRAKRKQRARSRTTVYGNGARRPDETSPTNRRPRLISDAGTVSSPDGSPPGSPRAGSPRAAGPTWAEGFDGQLTRRNVNEDDERVVKATMTAEELKEYDGVRVGQMGVGATFGELALLNENGVRSATAVAVGETTLVQVARSDFTKLVAELIQQKNESRMSVLQKTYAFGAWSTERMIKLCSFLLPFTFSRNTVIAAETSAISTVFIVTDGTVRLQKTIEDDEVIGVPTSGGSKDEASQQPQPQGQQQPPTERKRKPARHQVYSPRPRNNTADAPTIEVALLGPGAILGDVELAAGSRVYKGTYVATYVLTACL
jgi:CRP-like cAMP-binding protein